MVDPPAVKVFFPRYWFHVAIEGSQNNENDGPDTSFPFSSRMKFVLYDSIRNSTVGRWRNRTVAAMISKYLPTIVRATSGGGRKKNEPSNSGSGGSPNINIEDFWCWETLPSRRSWVRSKMDPPLDEMNSWLSNSAWSELTVLSKG